MTHYFNEFDPHAAQWLRELIRDGHLPPGEVDGHDIREVAADDVRRHRVCHWFAGVGGWPLALRLAGWPADRPVWTGSCPCQPYSTAGKRKGDADPRNLWPVWFPLIRECRPATVFGEQVEGAIRHGWLDRVSADLEGEGYAVASAVLPAACVGAPHQRHRLFWVAHLYPGGRPDTRPVGNAAGRSGVGGGGESRRLADRDRERQQGRAEPDGGAVEPGQPAPRRGDARGRGNARPGRMGSPMRPGLPAPEREDLCGAGRRQEGRATGQPSLPPAPGVAQGDADGEREGAVAAPIPEGPGVERTRGTRFWDDYAWLDCLDGKARRTQPGLFPLAHGVPGRVDALRGSGNALVPQVAAEFVAAFLETEEG